MTWLWTPTRPANLCASSVAFHWRYHKLRKNGGSKWIQMGGSEKKRYSGIIVFVLWKKWWFDDFWLICGSPMRRIPQIIQEMTDFQHSYCLFGPTVISLCKSPILSWLKRLDVYRCLFVGYIYICYRSISLPNDWQNNDVQIILMLSLDTPNYYIKLLNQVSWLVG